MWDILQFLAQENNSNTLLWLEKDQEEYMRQQDIIEAIKWIVYWSLYNGEYDAFEKEIQSCLQEKFWARDYSFLIHSVLNQILAKEL